MHVKGNLLTSMILLAHTHTKKNKNKKKHTKQNQKEALEGRRAWDADK